MGTPAHWLLPLCADKVSGMLSSLLALPLAPAPDPYDYSYNSDPTMDSAATLGIFALFMGIYAVIFLVIWLASGFAWAGLFGKAGQPKWAAFVPFYNTWIMVKIAGRPESNFWLQFIPYAGIYWTVLTLNDLAKSFGKDVAYTVGLIFVPVVFAAILSYGDAKYLGPAYRTPEQKYYEQQYGQQQYAPTQYGGATFGQHYGQPDPAAQQYPGAQQYPAQPPYGSGPTQQS
ncbi:hypothetical protein CVS28_07335 [Arthrobacter glacialis]|uniref:Signal peptidase I n=2 Tax=Arthrobacter glacialis TaxID=1664 RepID=A0A2S3ZYF7_ARTGL|nr:hypothetical protein CVS28_07335 [Arthrobacter glacialis]POH73952.1 hypothetical protein CVS27_08555 [Arthrobacter glacialis]